jgi:hypothetical protein
MHAAKELRMCKRATERVSEVIEAAIRSSPAPEEGDGQHAEGEDAECLELDLARGEVGVFVLLLFLLCKRGKQDHRSGVGQDGRPCQQT